MQPVKRVQLDGCEIPEGILGQVTIVGDAARPRFLAEQYRRYRDTAGVNTAAMAGIDMIAAQIIQDDFTIGIIDQHPGPAACDPQLAEYHQGICGIAAAPDKSLPATYLLIFTRVAVHHVNDVKCRVANTQYLCHNGRLRARGNLSTSTG